MSTTTDAVARMPIPATLNLVITAVAAFDALACLWLASHAPHWSLLVLAAIAFSFVNNTIFSLLHESVHGLYHPNSKINEVTGPLLAAFFPTSFTILPTSHFGHHERNQTDMELFDQAFGINRNSTSSSRTRPKWAKTGPGSTNEWRETGAQVRASFGIRDVTICK